MKEMLQSFYSGPFYGELARRHKGIGLGLVLRLSLVMIFLVDLLFFTTGAYAALGDSLAGLPAFVQNLPGVTVKDGRLSIDKSSPFTLTVGQSPDEAHIVVDTNYKVEDTSALESHMQKDRILLLLTSDRMVRYVQYAGDKPGTFKGALEITDFKDIKPFSISRDEWRNFGDSLSEMGIRKLTFFASFALFIVFFVYNLAGTIFSGIVVMIFDLFAKANIEFAAALRLASAFRIPVIFLSIVPVILGMYPLMGVSGWILWALYLSFAVWSVRLYSIGKVG